ncbi:MAG: thioredoxin family protein [Flavobacteriaceae bacterium]|jgi:thioredoxin-related protein|nr:thioredoxin family protein [Flavobacteriaceae bacterium]MBT4246509.1 thioredoxin family protein [Flavobacteriaceae bacterium]MBT4414719.1 thioredoxin family protein [Flavobacteriaceae bacterium]MBT5012413.1 thioredoxin family protein [Flavobacteriaceae bacterium]MBT5395419.1 thioredoxin family protein [Flavobacteriaceae bacterium]
MKSLTLIFCLSVFYNSYCQEWIYDYNDALNLASKSNKKIILVFQGSDWCAPCIKLEKDIWSSNEFIDYSNQNYIMLKADFPRKKKNALSLVQQEKNNRMAELYNKNGYFPFVVVINSKGLVLGESGYKKIVPSKYIQLIESF